ncbi:MAG: AraC family transcriptional regulator [Spirochaetales bacterium]|nr:AraC family transcriptional regulator [Spirochaetales bacterium]
MKNINKIFYHFIMAYIVLILIPLFTGIFLNWKIVNEYELHVKKSHLTYLKKTQDVLESFIEDIKWSTYQLANNTKLLRLISNNGGDIKNSEKSILIRETISELKKSLLYNTSFNSTFYIYLKNQDIILTPYSFYSHEDFNNSFNFFKMENIDSKNWHSFITSKYQSGKILKVRSTIIEDFKNKNMIPYIQTMPIDNSNNAKNITGAIVYLIGEQDFIKFLDYDSIPKGGFSYIADENNNILSLLSNTDKEIAPLILIGDEGMTDIILQGEKMLVIYTTSKKNSWKYVSVLPEEWVLKSVKFYQLLSIIIMSIALVLCLGVAFKLSQKWSKPLNRSIKSLTDYLKIGSLENESINSLDRHVNRLIDENEIMQDKILDQNVFVHNAFVNRVIHGFFKNEEGLTKYLNYIGFIITEKCFSVVVFSLNDFDLLGTAESFEDFNRIKEYLKTTIQAEIQIKMMISEQENSDIVIIFMTDNCITHKELVLDSLHKYVYILPSQYKTNLKISMGDSVNSLMDIHKSYIQAQDIQSLSDNSSENQILTTNSLLKKLENYYYPIEIESRLINSITSGNLENNEKLFQILYSENFTKRALNRENLKHFYSNLLSSYNRILNQIPENIKTQIITEYNNIDNINFFNIKELFSDICLKQNNNKKSHNNLLIQEVKDYLKSNYKNNNLSLYTVADNFSITESYLSFYFKEQTGINFSTYLEKIRIEESKKLLVNTNDTIDTIAKAVGYNSDKTFRRVFQKTLTISPSSFRLENKN